MSEDFDKEMSLDAVISTDHEAQTAQELSEQGFTGRGNHQRNI